MSTENARIDGAGEFDEMFIDRADVHIERMDTRSFWIGITKPDGNTVHVRTGVARGGKWYFHVEQNWEGGETHTVSRPACHRHHD